jgi:signal peptidase II
MRSPSKIVAIVTVLALSIGCDQLLKQIARTFLRYSPPISLFSDFVRLQYAENKGIMLSIGASLSGETRFWIFVIGVGLLLMAMLVYVLWQREMDRIQTVALALIVSGGFGNLIDRITRDGAVTDFISIGFGVVRTAVFNLADALVFAGVFCLLIHNWKKEKKSNIEKHHQSPSAGAGG